MPASSTPHRDRLHVVSEWYRHAARDLPWRRAQFHQQYGAWGVLVSEFMLQQTQVSRVIPRLAEWLDRWPTPAALAADPPADAVTAWDSLGYPRRALWLHRAATQITERHGGIVPRDVDELLALTGIGDYTARAVAVFAYGDRHPVVDTNTRRVLARAIDGVSHAGPASAADLPLMSEHLPADREASTVFNAAMMELGATVCTARSPECARCPLLGSCAWVLAGRPETEDRRRRQARYEGSDRQTRGAVLRVLRGASQPVPMDAVISDWPDPLQRDRAIDSLIVDGLAEVVEDGLRLPR